VLWNITLSCLDYLITLKHILLKIVLAPARGEQRVRDMPFPICAKMGKKSGAKLSYQSAKLSIADYNT
jgi:hypothetical protein